MDAHWLATGHYAQIRQTIDPVTGQPGKYELLKGVDDHKDQSYVLSVMGQWQLEHALFPVGGFTKPQIRQMARDFKLPVAEREESQDLCFLADNDYRRFIRERAGDTISPGPILRRDGTVIGTHQGLPYYTIGQRKGIGVAAPEALYVLGTQPANNALVVGTAAELGGDQLVVRKVNWVSGGPPAVQDQPLRAEVKIRYKAAPVIGHITPLPDLGAQVRFEERVRDITPGQAAVFYDGPICLGGGIIERPSS
jgi:tRNA-uridine 2-sulfurtransferase